MTAPIARLRALAKLHHVQTGYTPAGGSTRRAASADSLRAVLKALGVDANTETQVERAIAKRVKQLRSRVLEPVAVAWNGRLTITLRLGDRDVTKLRTELVTEDGETIERTVAADELRTKTVKGPDGEPETLTTFRWKGTLPAGYHTLRVTVGRTAHEALVLSAPTRCFTHDESTLAGAWGLFCPTYALRSERDTGCGDLTDLRALASWGHTHGARVIATLPLLSVFLDEPFEPSPYSPVSKLHWNELFLDPTSTPEFEKCAKAKRRAQSASHTREAEALRAGELVQYRRQASLRHALLQPLAEYFFDKGLDDSDEFRAFLDSAPDARQYARFRAVMDRQRRGWHDWSDRLRRGAFRSSDFDASAERLHIYAQFRFRDQLGALKQETRDRDGLLYLDLAVGVRGDGFDAFANQHLFGEGLSVGAPPDPTFLRGQDWGFPPMLPEAMREDRYAYFRSTIASHMRYCDALRLDHVMAFYRLWWVPPGMESADGVYAHYHMDEQIAVYAIESHKHRCQIVGENLGTVPAQVEKALDKHAMGPLFVAQMSTPERGNNAIAPVRTGAVASSNTHDMAPFMKWWDGTEANDREGVGLIDERQGEREREDRAKMRKRVVQRLTKSGAIRKGSPDAVRDAFHRHIAAGPAAFTLINTEDLWLATGSQNIPGTVDEHPNWRRRLRYELEEFTDDADVARQMTMIDESAQQSAQITVSTPSS